MELRNVVGGTVTSTLPETDVQPKAKTLRMERKFNNIVADPFDSVVWETRSAEIKSADGEVMFRADNLEFPKSWSYNASSLVAEKYFRFVDGVRETSVRQMISRIADTITKWGVTFGYFTGTDIAKRFSDELKYILLHQMAAFNSPVWFNIGTNKGVLRTEQASACFINSIGDTMASILELGVTEGKLYKGGSGSGVNYSPLRSSREKLSGGGHASGPVPFIAKDDCNAGAIKSGGTTRRAAKINLLNADHGDILEFIRCKANAEKAAHALIDAGFDGDFRARWGAYQLVPFQNANHSVRVTDAFMCAVEKDENWDLLARDGKVLETVKARFLWDEICAAAYVCGDPGLQFDTTINDWNTSPKSGRIDASNPCAEYHYLADTACNLASLNLLKFLSDDGTFNVLNFEHVVDVMITAQEILVDGASYPTSMIEANSSKYRTLGIGYSNLGALLMAQGIPYDSEQGRAQAACITAILSGRGYARSAELASINGPFAAYGENADDMMRVMRKHSDAMLRVADSDLSRSARAAWGNCIRLGLMYGYRNAQISVIAPAGTISFLMDCDTTGLEPDLSLRKTKKLVGGGTITIANQQIARALRKLKYSPAKVDSICGYVAKTGSVVGSGLADTDYAVFDTSLADPIGDRSLSATSHVLMMAAIQPFVSGALSKTVNLPSTATVEDISNTYKLAWSSGLKAVALYRDGCKRTQPLQVERDVEEAAVSAGAPVHVPVRRKLPADCSAVRHKFSIGGHEGYIHVGTYEDGSPAEVFVKMAKEGSTVSGLMDAVGLLTSLCLQYGVPLEVLVDKFSFTSFEPAGMTEYDKLRFAKSPLDYLFRWLGFEFAATDVDTDADTSAAVQSAVHVLETVTKEYKPTNGKSQSHGAVCGACGNQAQRTGSCTTCSTCGTTSGCG